MATPERRIGHRADAGRRVFRTHLELPAGAEPTGATVTIAADNLFDLFINGTRACSNTSAPDDWHTPRTASVGHLLHPGANLIAVAALIVDCAILRKESRGLHYTLDYPEPDESLCHPTTLRRF